MIARKAILQVRTLGVIIIIESKPYTSKQNSRHELVARSQERWTNFSGSEDRLNEKQYSGRFETRAKHLVTGKGD